jgi:prepilin-type N-terminal cleavage/methylation domain-containing protein
MKTFGTPKCSGRGAQAGFTLVEFAVVVAILVVVASFAIPRFRDAVERTRAGEAIQFLSDVRIAQERYQAALGRYAEDLSVLELTAPLPRNFKVGQIDVARKDGIPVAWSLTLTRNADTTAYGPYTVTFNERGYDARRSSLSMLPEISPIEETELFLP